MSEKYNDSLKIAKVYRRNFITLERRNIYFFNNWFY